MPGTLYVAGPRAGKTFLMREHVRVMRADPEAPFFFIVDHTDEWGPEHVQGAGIFYATAEWWTNPLPCAIFRGVPGREVAQLAIDVGWAVYVDDECDDALEGWKDSPVKEIMKRGRHLRNRAGQITPVVAMLASHRPGNFNPDVFGCIDRVYLGRIQGLTNAERAYREGWIRADNPMQAREILEARETGVFTTWPDQDGDKENVA